MLHVSKPVSQTSAQVSKKSKKSVRRKARSNYNNGNFVIRGFLERLGTARALTVWLLFKYGEHDQLVRDFSNVDPSRYGDTHIEIERLRKDYAASRFFSKTADLSTTIDKTRVAIDSAKAAESLCEKTNQYIKEIRQGSVRNPFDAEWFRAKQIIADILGEVPGSFESVGWSKGRTTSCSGTEISSVHKYTGQLDVTWSAQIPLLREMRNAHNWSAAVLDADGPCSILRSALNVVRGNVMITVPKNAKTDRVICYEPHGNIRVQLNVGSYIRHRLRKAGVDLNDQSVNQRRAQVGSYDGRYATIDLSAASDTIALELVYELLPIDWAILLDSLRSKETLWPDKEWRKNEKFSSMGNGFTFELESLIFYALARSVSSDVSVYGDDIIIPVKSFTDVINVLKGAGFIPNEGKSFSTGTNFRESCGFDGFCGVDVTPVYLRSLPKTRGDIVKLHNQIRRWVEVTPDRRWADFLKSIRMSSPHHLGPKGYGDGHYHVNFEEATPRKVDPSWETGWWYRTTTVRFRVSTLYGDRVHGRFSGKFGYAALCSATGPKRSFSAVDMTADRRLVVTKDIRAIATEWQSITFV